MTLFPFSKIEALGDEMSLSREKWVRLALCSVVLLAVAGFVGYRLLFPPWVPIGPHVGKIQFGMQRQDVEEAFKQFRSSQHPDFADGMIWDDGKYRVSVRFFDDGTVGAISYYLEEEETFFDQARAWLRRLW